MFWKWASLLPDSLSYWQKGGKARERRVRKRGRGKKREKRSREKRRER